MICVRVCSADRARAQELLDQATKLNAEEGPQFGVEDGPVNWCDWLICDLLLEEAEGKITEDGERGDVAPTQAKSASAPN